MIAGGAGRSLAKRLLDEMGGEVDLRSAPGRGTTFRVRLPQPASVGSTHRPVDSYRGLVLRG